MGATFDPLLGTLRTKDVEIVSPINVGNAAFRDDFMNFTGSGSVTASTGFASDTGWIMTQIVSGTQSVSQGDSTFANPGQVKFTTSTTSGQGIGFFKGNTAGGGGVLGALGSNSGWEINVVAGLNTASTNLCLRIGAAKSGQAATDPPSDGIYFEYDTANTGNSDTKFTGVTRSGGSPTYTNAHSVSADLNFHHFRIRSTAAGTMGFTVDGGTEDTTSSTVSLAAMTPFFQIITRTTSAAHATIDFFSYVATISRT